MCVSICERDQESGMRENRSTTFAASRFHVLLRASYAIFNDLRHSCQISTTDSPYLNAPDDILRSDKQHPFSFPQSSADKPTKE